MKGQGWYDKSMIHVRSTILGIILAACCAIFFVFPQKAEAITVKKADYAGAVVSVSPAKLALKPNETATVKIIVKNTGKATWANAGARYVSVYTYFPKYRTSVFYNKSWFRKDQPVKITEKSVAPGKTATITFKVTAPSKTGVYEEGFYLAAEEFTWIAGTQIKIPITVADPVVASPSKPAIPVTATPPVTPNPSSSGPLAAEVIIKSFKERIILTGGKTEKVIIGFKNTGSVIWQTRILRVRGTTVADTSGLALADKSWPNGMEPSRVREPISPGNVALFEFNITAPARRGDYSLPLKLVIDDKDVGGAIIDIPVLVTEDAPELAEQETPIINGATEPNIRVGLWKPDGQVVLSNSVPFSLVDGRGSVLTVIPSDTLVTIGYNKENKTVVANAAGSTYSSAGLMRFVPTDAVNGLFRVPNFAGWVTTLYENRFRGTLELNYYEPNDNVWLIEELPLEQYVQGLAETGNASHPEFQKALVIAARNYAYVVHQAGGKYALFDVLPDAADQVYRAYGSETYRPNLVANVKATRGMMVVYNNEVVVTPYFSRSDGRTRAWGEVWCCKVKPWLVGVAAPHDVGKNLWGHGVGMSAEDALGWAKDGKTYDWILNYFYTGTKLKRIY
jgi:hypothetical protein